MTRISENDSIGNIDISVGSNARGDIVVVWNQYATTGGVMLYGVRYDPVAGWRGQRQMRPLAGNVAEPSVAVDPAGNAVAAWKEQWTVDGSVMSAVFWNRSVAGFAGWDDAGPLHEFVSGFASSSPPAVSSGTTENVVATWAHNNAIARVVNGATGALSDQFLLSDGGGVRDPVAAIDSVGNLFAVWSTSDSALEFRGVFLDGGIGLGLGSHDFGSSFRVEVDEPPQIDSAGNAWMLFRVSDDFQKQLQLLRMSQNSSSIALVSTSVDESAKLAFGNMGRAYVAYREATGALAVNSLDADGGTMSARQSSDGANTSDEGTFDVTSIPDSGVVLVWLKTWGDRWYIWSAAMDIDGGLGAAVRKRIEPAMASESPDSLRVVTDPSGRSIVIFSYAGDIWAGETRF